jgi:hypothetical protein
MPISEQLKSEIDALRTRATDLSGKISSPTMKAWLATAIQDLDHIPKMFDSEKYVRAALIVPAARIQGVADAVERFGPDVQAIPADWKYQA